MINAQHLTKLLSGRWFGHYGLAFCPAHRNVRTPALSLSDTADGRLLAYCHAGCTFAAIITALQGRGYIDDGSAATTRIHAYISRPQVKEQAAPKRRAAHAWKLWHEAHPVAGTPAERYLRLRGITCPLPNTLRYHPECRHMSGTCCPALIAIVEGTEGFGVHRTFLQHDGSGKADLVPSKAMLGAIAGGAVRLSSEPGPLVVAEGIETALSLCCGILAAPTAVWASLSTSGMKSLRLPVRPGVLIIAADGDSPGREAAHALACRASAHGWQVTLLPAPQGSDWNNFLMKGDAA